MTRGSILPIARGTILAIVTPLAAVAFVACGGGSSESVETPVSPTSPARAVTDIQASDGDTVAVHYKGTLDNGETFDSSEGRQPLSFTVGTGQVIPGFDNAVRGLTVGETVTVRIEPENAYGLHLPDLIISIPAANMPEGLNLGDQITSGQGVTAIVLEITEEFVRIDANHELAGEALTFEIVLVSIK